ncbi:hypothetical protein SUDANB121_00065 [Nocardiopsis dassonvillei]|uniref:replication-relaxation family protein n=1 Tax=Nocardiopsis dassonvillei TaxID=2014 RepID=UPI003F54E0D5
MTEHGHTLESLSTRLTERDMAIICAVHDHQVLTTHQIERLYFADTGERRARRRLLILHRYGVLDRFRRYAARGTLPDHWLLAPLGVELLALHREVQVADLGFRRDQAMRLRYSVQLEHMWGLAESYVCFVEAGRGPGELVRWYGERECARRWGVHIRPDAYVRWFQEERVLHAFFEYDTGTESLSRLRHKMTGYANLARHSTLPSIVLFAVHSDQRAEHLEAKLAGDVTDMVAAYVTTHARLADPGPDRAVWRAVGSRDTGDRWRLTDIAHRHDFSGRGAG